MQGLNFFSQGERIYNFAGDFNFAIAIGLEMSIIVDPDPDNDSDPDDCFNIDAVPLFIFWDDIHNACESGNPL